MRFPRARLFAPALLAFLSIAVLAACAEGGPAAPESIVLTDFVQAETNDTVVNTPPAEAPPTPGSFHGFVIGFGAGPDTMTTAPRLEGVLVTAYRHLGFQGFDPIVGEAVGSTTTGAEGAFQFPTIPGGAYIVTFEPPASSAYLRTYAQTTISQYSNEGNWWIILPPK